MDFNNLKISTKLVPGNYLKLAVEAQRCKEIKIKELLEKRKLPEDGWSNDLIEYVVQQLSSLDSNNFQHKAGLGEREARIVCRKKSLKKIQNPQIFKVFLLALVAQRHYNFGHGIGRSGDLLEAQPKAVGSTILAQLTNALLLDLIRYMGIPSCNTCFLVPMATGMTLTLCFLSLRKQRPKAKYVLWSRIDQKSCFKSITTAGFTPVIINTNRRPGLDGLYTDISNFENKIESLPPEEILCIMSTTSCFAPRNCDDIIALAKISKKYDIPHVVNNAYGLQSTYFAHQIQQGHHHGRIDLFIQSTDKNLMVPVGGAIIAGFDKQIVHNVAKTYAGRASSSQSLDVFMTLLALGKKGYLALTKERKQNFDYLKEQLHDFAGRYNCKVLDTKDNPISIAVSINSLNLDQPTQLGSMLYTRGISGTRVLAEGSHKTIDGFEFKNWGTHEDVPRPPYLTVASTLGLKSKEIDVFLQKLKDCWKDLSKLNNN